MTTYNSSPAFHEAVSYLASASSLSKVSNTVKLELYGLFKYLTVSHSPNTPRPSLFDLTGKAKWDAWSATAKTYEDRASDAERRYLEIARVLGWTEGIGAMVDSSHGNTGDDVGLEGDWNENSEPRNGPGGGGGGMAVSVSAIPPPLPEESDTGTIHGFAISDDVNSLSLFLDAHPDTNINERDEFGYTPLHLAGDRGNVAVTAVLLRRGADPSLKDPDNLTPAELAQIAGHDDVVEVLGNARH